MEVNLPELRVDVHVGDRLAFRVLWEPVLAEDARKALPRFLEPLLEHLGDHLGHLLRGRALLQAGEHPQAVAVDQALVGIQALEAGVDPSDPNGDGQ